MTDEYHPYRIKKENRIKSHSMSNKDKFWCGGCDANLVGSQGKCSNCGTLNSINKIKKFDLKD